MGLRADLLKSSAQLVASTLDLVRLLSSQRSPQYTRCLVNRLDLVGSDLVLQLVLSLVRRVEHALSSILQLNLLLPLPILLSKLFRFSDHLLLGFLREFRRRGDSDLVLFPCAKVLRVHVKHPVSVNVEGDLDLGHTSRRGRYSGQVEHS